MINRDLYATLLYVRPSVREAFYDLRIEKQTLDGNIESLRIYETFQDDHKDEFLERYKYN
ncbi:hypothetical protein H8356DRAFT_1336509 [Neocallimastix lanati (nom. inval.)]|nr:hypothetical protein H8356DRAFT_1336509 [Neocallimastix sp. JGI-2020a]